MGDSVIHAFAGSVGGCAAMVGRSLIFDLINHRAAVTDCLSLAGADLVSGIVTAKDVGSTINYLTLSPLVTLSTRAAVQTKKEHMVRICHLGTNHFTEGSFTLTFIRPSKKHWSKPT